jgi:hypothetical protein
VSERDPYAYWRAALEWRADPKAHPMPDFDPKHPETGFYRGQRNEAVAIWWRDGSLDGHFPPQCMAMVHAPSRTGGGVSVSNYDRADIISESVFAYCCRHPITFEAYKLFTKTGVWPEDIRHEDTRHDAEPRTKEEKKPESGTPEPVQPQPALTSPEPASAGDNLPKEPERALEAELEDLLERSNAWFKSVNGKIANQSDADKCANYATAVAELEKRALAAKEVEKRPILTAGAAIEAKWRTVLDRAATAKTNLKALMTSWLSAQKKAQLAEQAAAAEQRRQQAAAGQVVDLPRAQPSRSVAGTTGRVSLKTVTVYSVANLKDASTYLASMETPPADFVEAVRLCGQRLMKAGVPIPGISVSSEEVAV